MKLPDNCPVAKMSPRQLLETEIRQLDCCRAGEVSYHIGTDEPLCRPRKTNHEVYRFIWRSSFDGDAVVDITRKDQAIALRWKRTFTAAAPSVTLSLNDWEELQRALKAARFWSLDNAEKQWGLDGAQWLIKGRRGDIYHSVDRWSPEGAVHDLGRLFFALAGSPLASVELY
jgi:hypothetical protein